MKIAYFTNTFTPHTGGVAHSSAALAEGMRCRGHQCLVVAPEFPGQPEDEPGVLRIPSLQHFNGTDFSFRLPSGTRISDALHRFQPDLIHCHHPFLLGDAGLRMAHQWDLPLVFTHHTRYENYVHYVLEESDWLERLAVELATEFANLCDLVIAPSGSIARLIQERGVNVPVEVIPTGIDRERFASGDRDRVRRETGCSPETFLLGHVGRLAEEKNLPYLMEAVSRFLKDQPEAAFLLVGEGDCQELLREISEKYGVADRVYWRGKLTGQELVDHYRAMDLFAFSSRSETQGMVLAEAMASGVPVIALDASGVRDIVRDGENGWLLKADTRPEAFARALAKCRDRIAEGKTERETALEETARAFSAERSLERTESVYRALIDAASSRERDLDAWARFSHRLEAEWDLAVGRVRAVGAAFRKSKESGL